MLTEHRRLFFILFSIPVLLLIPLIANHFSNEVDWKLGDFLVMGFLLLLTGLFIEWIARKIKHTSHRIMLFLTVWVLFFLVWAELGVGLFGTPFAGV